MGRLYSEAISSGAKSSSSVAQRSCGLVVAEQICFLASCFVIILLFLLSSLLYNSTSRAPRQSGHFHTDQAQTVQWTSFAKLQ